MAKKFSFSLQKLLSYKEQLFDIEQTILNDMRAVLHGFEQELLHLQREHIRRSDEFNQKMLDGTTPAEMERYKNYMMMIDLNIQHKEKQIELQKLAIDKQMDKVRECKIEISTIEKLREKKLEEYRYNENKAEELFIEEFVSNTKAASYSA